MPYSLDELKNKPSYQNILDADRNELKKFFEDDFNKNGILSPK